MALFTRSLIVLMSFPWIWSISAASGSADGERPATMPPPDLAGSIERSDPGCREEVVRAFARALTFSFRATIRGFFHSHNHGWDETFVPPDRYRRSYAAAFPYNGEVVTIIGPDRWSTLQTKIEKPVQDDLASYLGSMAPSWNNVGECRRLDGAEQSDASLAGYDFVLHGYNESPSARDPVRTLHVRRDTGLPVRIVSEAPARRSVRSRNRFQDGEPTAYLYHETRTYDPGLTIEPPPTPPG